MGMPHVLIRVAKPVDAEFLTRGNAAMALETENIVLDPPRLRAGVDAIFADASRGVYYIAEIEGNIGKERVGQMLITFEWSDWRNGNFWWIQSVWVEPAFRGNGVFRKLYAHVHALARADGSVCGLRLYVEHHNARAQATYERCGMKRTAYQMFSDDFVL
jgi:ribosomal protein S18 acetylase RimI-like enzyme